VGRGEKENKMVSNCKKLDDGSNILNPWEKKSTTLLQVCERRVIQGFRNAHKTEE
jgi:hypothetical protein